jgi:excisionase family DNA binding protein
MINERASLSPEEYAQRHAVSRVTVYRLIKAGKLEYFMIGRSIRIPVGAIPTQQEEET